MLGAADVLADDKVADIPEKLEARRIGGVDALEISGMMMESHARSLDVFLRDSGVSEKHSFTTMATLPQLRMTRRLCGV